MPTFFSAALLAVVVVVVGVTTIGWMRGRSMRSEDASNKKVDKEVMTDGSIEIIVTDDKQSLTGSTTPRDHRKSNQSHHSIARIGSTLGNKLSLELVNRRQYVKAVCDRFETWSNGSVPSSDNEHDNTAVRPVGMNDQEASSYGNATAAFRTKAKPNNLTSFVRQCVSNIERSAFAPSNSLPSRTISPRNSMASNQCESPPEVSMMDERRVPDLVITTDCDLSESNACKVVDVEVPILDEGLMKRTLRRVPSDIVTPIAFARSFAANTAPTLAPFAATATKPLPANSLPPVWTRASRPEASSQVDPLTSKSDEIDPAEVEEPIHLPGGEEETHSQSLPIPPAPRKSSNAASRLLQFQQLVPSNRARTPSVVQQ